MGSYEKAIESYKNTITTAASLAASVMLVRGMVNEIFALGFPQITPL
jgi:mitochondrial chaperone BCS1